MNPTETAQREAEVPTSSGTFPGSLPTASVDRPACPRSLLLVRPDGASDTGEQRGHADLHEDAEIEANYTDTHGASVVGFAFTELLGFRLLPRFKNIGSIKLYSPDDGPATWKNLERVIVNRPIDWDKITQQYDQMVKYATALRLGTAGAEQMLRRFTKGGGPKSGRLRAGCRTGPVAATAPTILATSMGFNRARDR